MLQDIFDAITEVIGGFITIIQTLFADDGIIAVFYDATNGLTLLGSLLLLVFGYGMVRWAFSYVRRLIRLKG